MANSAQTQHLKTSDEFYEDLALSFAKDDTPCIIDMKTATARERAKERARRLAAPTTKHRFVFRQWPRDPDGQIMKPDEHRGKETPNGIKIWGATLLDLYHVRRIPNYPNLVTTSSGSRLAPWMTAHGELHANDALVAADYEDFPRVISPYDIGTTIKSFERSVISEKRMRTSEEQGKEIGWEFPENMPPHSPFDPSAYPSHWPREPFATHGTSTRPPTFRSYITPSCLPEKLIIHDPYNLLRAGSVDNPDLSDKDENDVIKSWNQMDDITHVYKLQPSAPDNKREVYEKGELFLKDLESEAIRKDFLRDPHSKRTLPVGYTPTVSRFSVPGPCKPPIYVVYPHRHARTQPAEAHLYLSPAGALGTGHHSFVYKAELELPRSFLVDSEICHDCMLDDLSKILKEQDGPDGRQRDPKWDQMLGRYVRKQTHKKLASVVSLFDDDGIEQKYVVSPAEETWELVYEGPYRVIESRVQYQDVAVGPYCEHLRERIHPLTSTVEVAAKLSLAGDEHLKREAANYQAFPRHFFEHWSGYNIVPPLRDPVPIGPLVPQFYGYYVVEENYEVPASLYDGKVSTNMKPGHKSVKSTSGSSSPENSPWPSKGDIKLNGAPYLSPVLLIENCGTPITPSLLSVDDKNECASLIHRFHSAWWYHGSVARRNILRQPATGLWSDQSDDSSASGPRWSYRLIDFGRSRFTLGDGNTKSMRGDTLGESSSITTWLYGITTMN